MLAYTAAGDGVVSQPVTCSTEEDGKIYAITTGWTIYYRKSLLHRIKQMQYRFAVIYRTLGTLLPGASSENGRCTRAYPTKVLGGRGNKIKVRQNPLNNPDSTLSYSTLNPGDAPDYYKYCYQARMEQFRQGVKIRQTETNPSFLETQPV